MISHRGQIAFANRSTLPPLPYPSPLILLPFPKETRRKRFARTHAGNTAWKYRGDGGVPPSLHPHRDGGIRDRPKRKVIATAASCRGVNAGIGAGRQTVPSTVSIAPALVPCAILSPLGDKLDLIIASRDYDSHVVDRASSWR